MIFKNSSTKHRPVVFFFPRNGRLKMAYKKHKLTILIPLPLPNLHQHTLKSENLYLKLIFSGLQKIVSPLARDRQKRG